MQAGCDRGVLQMAVVEQATAGEPCFPSFPSFFFFFGLEC